LYITGIDCNYLSMKTAMPIYLRSPFLPHALCLTLQHDSRILIHSSQFRTSQIASSVKCLRKRHTPGQNPLNTRHLFQDRRTAEPSTHFLFSLPALSTASLHARLSELSYGRQPHLLPHTLELGHQVQLRTNGFYVMLGIHLVYQTRIVNIWNS